MLLHQVREKEFEMKTIDEIQCELRDLIHELELIKEERSSGEFEIDWERISVDACAKAIKPHPLEEFDEYSQKCYMTILLTVAWLDEQRLAESLFLVHRIAFGMGYLEKHGDLRDEYIAAKTLSYKQLDELSALFADKDEKLMLILECLLIAGTFEKGRNDAVEYIAKLSELLGLTKENMVFLSNLAAVVLTQDTDNYKCNIRNEWSLFDCYLKNFDYKIDIIRASSIEIQNTDKYGHLGGMMSIRFECLDVVIHNNKLKFKCAYTEVHAIGYISEPEVKNFIQDIPDNFLLLADAKDVYPNSPVGVVASPLTPISYARKIFDKTHKEFMAQHPVQNK